MELNKLNSLVELFFEISKSKNINDPFLEWLKPEQRKSSYNWDQVDKRIRVLSKHLSKNLSLGDRVVLLSENRPEWLIADLAIMNAGGVTVPLFTTYSQKDYEYIINDCKPKIFIISNDIQYEKIKKFISKETLIFSFENFDRHYDSEINDVSTLEEIFEIYSANPVFSQNVKLNYNKDLKRNNLACIIYTSGTTGNPKGVMLSHGGILSNCEGAQEILASLVKNEKPVFLTWLPLSHSYEHTVQYVQILLGAKIYYAESLEKLLPNMAIAQPTIMTAVPRFYQNLYSKILLNFSKQKGLKKKLIDKTILLGTKNLNKGVLNFNEKIINFLCEKLVRKKSKISLVVN